VADLAAAGHGNREIAQRLYVTRRTVETHLTHVFAKLGISGRPELVEVFAHTAQTVHQS
jgi:DNA-binding CsgD family transcriptional regulator